ncbi:DUF3426 domain-containing protein [Rhizomicrobium electricum]|uniref:Zinc-ribbon domain-containing protein n=1 Tax=Rhizomicrobium electricum TaxID=480070 RepID=A0ABP3Q7K2_9PROT|nr:DUF3426 domain-containing protein [Rhizomicrobium electricum]
MILTCPACETRYEVDAAKFPPQGRNVRCARCSNVWHAMGEPVSAFEPEPAEPEPPPREVYAQPEPRDPEPQETSAYEEPPPEPRGKLWQQPWFLKTGWAALAGIVILIGVIATVYRHQVVETWPQSASVYSKLGMKVAASGLKIGNTRNLRELRNGRLVLTVSGALTNVTDRELPVPQIRIGLVDNDKREIYHWTVAPDVITLKPGQSTRFVTRLSNPPEGVSEVRIAKAGE